MNRKHSVSLLLAFAIFLISAVPIFASQTVDFETFSHGTMLYSQVPGVLFLGKPSVETYASAGSGTQVLHALRPGQEFHTGPLEISFTTPQDYVSLKAGLIRFSAGSVSASLRAYDSSGNLVATDTGTIPAGPNSITREFTVSTAGLSISRIELQYAGSLFEAIDDLTFSNQGPPAPGDGVDPVVEILDPVDGEILTAEDFLFQATIVEENMNYAELTISNGLGSSTFRVSYFGTVPNLTVGPTWVGDLSPGNNTVTLTAVDLSGNVGTDSVTVTRAPVEGQLVIVDEGPWVVPRTPGTPEPLRVEMAETFPGSLDGSSRVTVEVVGPSIAYGTTSIQDPGAPGAFADLDMRAFLGSPLGATTITLQATDTDTGMVLDTATIRASVVPSHAVDCETGTVTYYQLVDRQELEDELNATVDFKLTGLGVEVQDGGGIDPTIPTDSDSGLPLTFFTSREAFVDLDGNGTYSVFEPVYADADGSGTVNNPDQRLKHPPTSARGSFVVPGDVDDGDLLTPFPANIRYVDLNNNSILDASLEEPIYRDNQSDGVVGHSDIRLADALVAPPLVKKNDMTVDYRDNFYAPGGLLRVAQEFWAVDGDSQADVDYVADLRITQVASREISFTYDYLHVAITGWFLGLPVGDWHWSVQDAEDTFRDDFAYVLRDELGPSIVLKVEEKEAGASAFLADGYFNDTELGIGFCLDPDAFPGDDIPSDS